MIVISFVRRLFTHLFPDKNVSRLITYNTIRKSIETIDQKEAFDKLCGNLDSNFASSLDYVRSERDHLTYPTTLYSEDETVLGVLPTAAQLKEIVSSVYCKDPITCKHLQQCVDIIVSIIGPDEKMILINDW